MAAYEVGFDETRGYVVCRVAGVLGDSEVKILCRELDRELTAARQRGAIRLLWDHRGLRVLVDGRADDLLAVGRCHFREGDRVAILVSHSLDKVEGKPKTAEEAAFFMSENAAHTWLNIGVTQAA
ncbi:hypothetical protein LWE61_19840 [Sphingobium sufflavum]|uniref:hypothetical protein n=1 Tax=Sphingobium sufflavum TaxID=1129547 RepID=UPI001F338029|nr:hypothetical protein [Sphingobium sufflavum]MCE7798783.1 hypothetical protein [Sphingobium sufflavum]